MCLNEAQMTVLFDWIQASDFDEDRIQAPAEVLVGSVGTEL